MTPDPPTPQNVLDSLDALEREATAGLWIFDPVNLYLGPRYENDRRNLDIVADLVEDHPNRLANGEFLALSRNHLRALIDVSKAAQKYREIGLADPTSLDLPPAGSTLDHAIAVLLTPPDEKDTRA